MPLPRATMNAADPAAAAAHVGAFYERLTSGDLDRLGSIYAADAEFHDPFNHVHGPQAIRSILQRMFEQLGDCRFRILETFADERGAMLVWTMTFRIRRLHPDVLHTIQGVSHLRFDDQGRVVYHRDYWDAAGELYARLPLIGPLMRMLQRKLGG